MKKLIILLIFIISLTIVFKFALKRQKPTERFDICIYSYIAGILSTTVILWIILEVC